MRVHEFVDECLGHSSYVIDLGSGHVPEAINIELGAVARAEVLAGPMTVMCGHGERARTGASILAAAGRADVSVLDGGPDTWAAATGCPLAAGR